MVFWLNRDDCNHFIDDYNHVEMIFFIKKFFFFKKKKKKKKNRVRPTSGSTSTPRPSPAPTRRMVASGRSPTAMALLPLAHSIRTLSASEVSPFARPLVSPPRSHLSSAPDPPTVFSDSASIPSSLFPASRLSSTTPSRLVSWLSPSSLSSCLRSVCSRARAVLTPLVELTPQSSLAL